MVNKDEYNIMQLPENYHLWKKLYKSESSNARWKQTKHCKTFLFYRAVQFPMANMFNSVILFALSVWIVAMLFHYFIDKYSFYGLRQLRMRNNGIYL